MHRHSVDELSRKLEALSKLQTFNFELEMPSTGCKPRGPWLHQGFLVTEYLYIAHIKKNMYLEEEHVRALHAHVEDISCRSLPFITLLMSHDRVTSCQALQVEAAGIKDKC